MLQMFLLDRLTLSSHPLNEDTHQFVEQGDPLVRILPR